MTERPIDELAARRRAKAEAGAPRPTVLEALERVDFLLIDAIERLLHGQLLVSVEDVRAITREADSLVLGCILAERERAGAR